MILVFLVIGGYCIGIVFWKDGSWVVFVLFLFWVWIYLLGRESEVYDLVLIVVVGYLFFFVGYGLVLLGFWLFLLFVF